MAIVNALAVGSRFERVEDGRLASLVVRIVSRRKHFNYPDKTYGEVKERPAIETTKTHCVKQRYEAQ